MKKYVLLFALSLAMLSGCAQATPSDTLSSEEHCFAPITYTFSGECDDIALTDGRLSLNPSTTCNEKEILDAGTLIIKNKPPFQNVTAMRASMYLLDNNKRYELTTINRSSDNNILPLESIDGPLGSTVVSTHLLGTKKIDAKHLNDHFFFELITTHNDGTTTTYTLPLELTSSS